MSLSFHNHPDFSLRVQQSFILSQHLPCNHSIASTPLKTRSIAYVYKENVRTLMEQYRLLAECLLPAHILDWFDLQNVSIEKKGDTQVIHLYIDENEQTPDDRDDLRPNGFTCESVFHDFPIRGQEVLLHVRRRRWLDADGHNVMTECGLIQESTRYSTELADFLKDAFGDAPNNGPFV